MFPGMKILIASVLSLTMITAVAQKNAGTKNTPAQKTKIILKTSLGNYTDSLNLPVDEVTQLIGVPFKVTDDKKNVYALVTYQFIYKRQAVTESDDMEKVSPTTSMASARFSVTPLPEIWLNNIRQGLKPAEELFYFDIVVKDAQGKLYFAPNLKIITK